MILFPVNIAIFGEARMGIAAWNNGFGILLFLKAGATTTVGESLNSRFDVPSRG